MWSEGILLHRQRPVRGAPTLGCSQLNGDTNPLRVVITGLSGFLGSVLLKSKPVGVEIVGTTRAPAVPANSPGVTWESIALDNRDHVSELFARHTPDVVIHAAGEASVDRAQADPITAVQSNVVTTTHLAQACSQHNCHLVYISSNAVFSGVEAPYAEDAPTRPVNNYGLLKVASEQVALALNPTTTIVRPILMYGWPTIGGRTNPVHFVIKKLCAGDLVQMVDDVFENPLYVDQCAAAIWNIVNDLQLGVFHLAGATRVNRFELALATAEAFDLDASLISAVGSDAFPTIAPRPADTTFVTNRMEDVLGVAPLSLADGLAHMRSNKA